MVRLLAGRPLPRATHVVSPRPLVLYAAAVAKRARRARGGRPPLTVVKATGGAEVLADSGVSSATGVSVSFHTIFLRCDDCVLPPSKINMRYSV